MFPIQTAALPSACRHLRRPWRRKMQRVETAPPRFATARFRSLPCSAYRHQKSSCPQLRPRRLPSRGPRPRQSPERPRKRPRQESSVNKIPSMQQQFRASAPLKPPRGLPEEYSQPFPTSTKNHHGEQKSFASNLPPPLAVASFRCYNACQHMADWKQITARIRRARTGKDPVGQLSNLYEKTRDAMVAFELARYFETAGQNPEAAKWYLAAADRFRRADWKTKAQEAAVRLGAEVAAIDPAHSSGDFMLTPPSPADSGPAPSPEEKSAASETSAAPAETDTEAESASVNSAKESADSPDKKRRRRGRRGGR